MDERHRQLFVLGPDIWDAITWDNIRLTGKDMQELGIFKVPVTKFDIQPIGTWHQIQYFIYQADVSPDHTQTNYVFRYDFEDESEIKISIGNKSSGKFIQLNDPNLPTDIQKLHKLSKEEARGNVNILVEIASFLVGTLIILLATKNADRMVRQNKLAKFGIGKKNKQYDYITTIKLGKITESMPSDGARGPIRPHLRRGHIRTQHFGVGNKEIKKIFIQPVFVNADEGWIADQRKAYVVKAA